MAQPSPRRAAQELLRLDTLLLLPMAAFSLAPLVCVARPSLAGMPALGQRPRVLPTLSALGGVAGLLVP